MGLKIDDRAGNCWEYQGGFFREAVNAGDPCYEYGFIVVGLGDMMIVSLGRDLFVKHLSAVTDYATAAIEVITRDGSANRMLWSGVAGQDVGKLFWVTGVEFLSECDGPDGTAIKRYRALLKPSCP